jgi:arylsulfatase A-like enzyme
MSRLNVILIIADCLRPDLPILGYPRDTTPLLGPHLARGRGYSGCRSTCGWTLPACASIVTGRPPTEHGLVDHDGRFAVPKLGHFLGADYLRLGIGNNGNLVPDDIDEDYLRRLGAERNSRWKRFGWNLDFDEYRWFHRLDHDGPFIEAERFLRERSGEPTPFLLMLHTNVVHDYGLDRPYYRAVGQWFAGELPAELESFRDGPGVWRELRARFGDDYLAHQIKARYDCGVVELDRRLAALFDLIDFGRTLVVLVGDHGEGFRPGLGRVHHCGRLHDDLLRVPLFLWAPAACGVAAEVDDRICSTLDIVPTVLELLGLPAESLPGRSLLAPVALGHRPLNPLDRGYAYLPGSLERLDYASHRIRIDADLTWPLKRITLSCDGAETEEWFNLATDPGEELELLGLPPPAGLPALSIVVAVNDWAELDQHLARSPLRTGGRHQWILLDNTGNRLSGDLCRVYARGLEQADSDLVIFAHQDVFFPPGWEQDFARALAGLAAVDPEWGVIGSVGVELDPTNSGVRQLAGHWCDPAGHHRLGLLPAKVQSLDEQWLGIRRASGLAFDEALPGLHCYGMDLCLTARSRGLGCYAIDAFAWHKYLRADGTRPLAPQDSEKIMRRMSREFLAEVQPSYGYVARKWRDWYPFASTSMTWTDPDDAVYRGPRWRFEPPAPA